MSRPDLPILPLRQDVLLCKALKILREMQGGKLRQVYKTDKIHMYFFVVVSDNINMLEVQV